MQRPETRGRQVVTHLSPSIPVEYKEAVRALQKCISLDETKYWSNKADALAAWAKIFRSDQAEREAKALKLHAYRRMAQLAQELRPQRMIGGKKSDGTARGSTPGARSLLKELGLKPSHINAARMLFRMKEPDFFELVDRARPPAINTIAATRLSGSQSWRIFNGQGGSVSTFRSFCRRADANTLASGLAADEIPKARVVVEEIVQWINEFKRTLAKSS